MLASSIIVWSMAIEKIVEMSKMGSFNPNQLPLK